MSDSKPKTKTKKNWLPLEGNPEVMNKYIHNLGAPPTVSLHDILSCDDWALDMIPRPVYGVLLTYPIKKEGEALDKAEMEKIEAEGQAPLPDTLWYTKQTVGNACGTIGLLHLLLNCKSEIGMTPASFLENFYEKTKGMTPEEKAKALEEDNELEVAHSSVEREGETRVPDTSEKIDTHFVAFCEVGGRMWELDGRKKFPLDRGETNPASFLGDAMRVIKTCFMDRDPEEIRFSMLALGPSM